ncbi:hypothetical protein DL96DRAFT_214179 [Flagelloscypha sp. PMI_526]|nr:hypothetical protein DL96DRAFT_214179 [Flagelloscypha sp. PMI_526]
MPVLWRSIGQNIKELNITVPAADLARLFPVKSLPPLSQLQIMRFSYDHLEWARSNWEKKLRRFARIYTNESLHTLDLRICAKPLDRILHLLVSHSHIFLKMKHFSLDVHQVIGQVGNGTYILSWLRRHSKTLRSIKIFGLPLVFRMLCAQHPPFAHKIAFACELCVQNAGLFMPENPPDFACHSLVELCALPNLRRLEIRVPQLTSTVLLDLASALPYLVSLSVDYASPPDLQAISSGLVDSSDGSTMMRDWKLKDLTLLFNNYPDGIVMPRIADMIPSVVSFEGSGEKGAECDPWLVGWPWRKNVYIERIFEG